MPGDQQVILSLEALRSRLQDGFVSIPTAHMEAWTDEIATKRMINQVREVFDTPAPPSDPNAISASVAAFRRTGLVENFRDLKYVCLGAGSPDERGRTIVSDERLREKLFAAANASGDSRRQIKCLQALLRGYWSFPLHADHTDEVALAGFRALGAWLERKRRALESSPGRKPGWMSPLSEHSNLLGSNPCERYGPSLLEGNTAPLRSAVESLAIPTDSWVMQEAVLSQMKSASKLRDDDFKSVLDKLMPIATGKAGVFVPRALQTKCVALLVARYSRCSSAPEQRTLRDAAVSVIGNPWLRRASWDAAVVDSKGRPDDGAREMINGWLKRRLIGDFFELLSADGAGDTRRLDYWLRFEPFVEDMWFALGTDAQYRRGEEFEDFRHRARGRLLDLDQTTADNNAFVMRIGEYLAVEFGAKGNAFYLFRWETIPSTLSQKLLSGKERSSVSVHDLKNRKHIDRLIHRDSESAGLTWEQKFDDVICPLIGQRPNEPARRFGNAPRVKPAKTAPKRVAASGMRVDGMSSSFNMAALARFALRNDIKIDDHRPKGGALWVRTDDQSITVVLALRRWGFDYKAGKGWWKE
jgi:hypothetical protein